MFFFLHECEIIPGYRSDHSGVLLNLQINFDTEKGRGYWKFNNTLLKDIEYVNKVKKVINETLDIYRVKNNNNNNNNNNNDNNNNNNGFTINDQLLLETILLMIRGETIKYSSFKKKQKNEQEINLDREIKELEERVQNNLNSISMEDITLLNNKKEKMEEIRKTKLEGVMLRSRCHYEDLGEKPTKYFLNMENRNYQDKVINNLIDENGEEIFKTKDILEAPKKYYSKLYTENIQIGETTGSNWCFSFAPELVRYSAPRDLHRRAAYSVCESWFLIHQDVYHDLFVCS